MEKISPSASGDSKIVNCTQLLSVPQQLPERQVGLLVHVAEGSPERSTLKVGVFVQFNMFEYV
jgi:hypothetical protein